MENPHYQEPVAKPVTLSFLLLVLESTSVLNVRQSLLVGYQLLWKPIPGYQSCGCLPDYPDTISISWVYLWLYIVTCTADLN